MSDTTEEEEYHRKNYKPQFDSFNLEIVLFEDESSAKEANNNGASTNHRHNTNHCSWKTQSIEINEVGSREKNADKDDAPVPMEWGSTLMSWPPKEN